MSHSTRGWSGFWYGQDHTTPKRQVRARNWFVLGCWSLMFSVAIAAPTALIAWLVIR